MTMRETRNEKSARRQTSAFLCPQHDSLFPKRGTNNFLQANPCAFHAALLYYAGNILKKESSFKETNTTKFEL